MTTIHTAYGEGQIVDKETVRGRTSYKVAGYGFEVWLPEKEVFKVGSPHTGEGHTVEDAVDEAGGLFSTPAITNAVAEYGGSHIPGTPGHNPIPSGGHSGSDAWAIHGAQSFDFEPSNHTWDNHTTLPYGWKPQYPVDMFRHEQTQSPDHEIDLEDRTHSSDSRTGEDREDVYSGPGPNPKLFAGAFAPQLRPVHDPDFDEYEEYVKHPNEYNLNGSEDYRPHHRGAFDPRDATPDQVADYESYLHRHDLARPEPSWQDHINADALRGQHQDYHRMQDPDLGRFGARWEGHPDSWPFKPNAADYEEWDKAHPEGPEAYHREHEASWEPPAGLSDKYAHISLDAADHFNDPVVRFKDDPHREIHRHGSINLSAGLDPETGEWMDLIRADKQLRTAAWREVASKAKRLKSSGAVHVKAMDPSAIYASVDGDNGTYDVMILRGSAYSGMAPVRKQAIANWQCSCEWGKWAFKRKLTYVGRLCSHGYATYLTQQSAYMKDKHQKRQKAAGVDDFKKWVKEENGNHFDQDAANTYLSQPDKDIGLDEAQAVLDYINTHHSEHPERDYDVKGYHYENDGPLRNDPGKLTPHLFVVPDDHYHDFEDLGDDRKTTGPGQITAAEHHPAFAWHAEDEPDFPKDGIVHFSSLYLQADEVSLERLRQLSEEPYEPRRMEEHNHEVSEVVSDLRERGYDVSPMVAKKAMWKKADQGITLDPNADTPYGWLERNVFGVGGGQQQPSTPAAATTPSQPNPGTSGDVGVRLPGGGHAPVGGQLQDALAAETRAQGHLPGTDAVPPAGGGPAPINQVTPGGGGVFTPDNPNAGTHGMTEQMPGPGGSGAGAGAGGTVGTGQGYGGAGFQSGGGWKPSQETTKINPGGGYDVKSGDTAQAIADRAGVSLNQVQGLGNNPNLITPGQHLTFGQGGGGGAGAGGGGANSHAPTSPGGSPLNSATPPGAGSGPKTVGAPAPGAPGIGGGEPKGVNIHSSAKRFAELYFTAEEDDNGGDDEKKNAGGSTTPTSTQPQGEGANYKPLTNPGQAVNAPRPQPSQASPATGPQAGAAPGPQQPQTKSTTSEAPGQNYGNPAGGMQGRPTGPGAPGQGLQQALSIAEPIMQGIGGALGGLPVIGPAISGLTNAIGPAMSGLSGLSHLGSTDAERFAARYFQADGNFDGEGGGDWMDHSFAGSGPDRHNWMSTSESYIDEHETANRDDTWVIDLDGKVTKYNDRPVRQRPKQARAVRRHADMLSGDAGFNSGPTDISGGATLSPGGSGQGLGGSVTEPASAGAQSPGALYNANISKSAREFWADVEIEADSGLHAPDTGFFNPRNPTPKATDKVNPKKGPKKPGQPGNPNGPNAGEADEAAGDAAGAEAEAGEAAGGLGELAEAAPLIAAASLSPHVHNSSIGDDTDIVRMFQASGGGCIGYEPQGGGGTYSDDGIALQAQRLLRTAGRKFTPMEEAELENESHHQGARNLGDLNLAGTHYLDSD